jgi:hypothetical protein
MYILIIIMISVITASKAIDANGNPMKEAGQMMP